ncbi:hypothetical protein D3C79_928340 [compost metagenome]
MPQNGWWLMPGADAGMRAIISSSPCSLARLKLAVSRSIERVRLHGCLLPLRRTPSASCKASMPASRMPPPGTPSAKPDASSRRCRAMADNNRPSAPVPLAATATRLATEN